MKLYKSTYEDMLTLLKNGKEVESNYLEQDTTQYPFAINVVNPFKGKYFAPPCKVCGSKSCNNCPLPIENKTLRQFLEEITNHKKFNDNDNMFKSQEQLKEEQNNNSDDEKPANSKKKKHWMSQNDDDDDDDNNP